MKGTGAASRWTGGHRAASSLRAALTLALAGALLAGCRIEPVEREELARRSPAMALEARVAALLQASAEGWNGGDLNAFMGVYLDAPETTYVGGEGRLLQGYDAIRDRYAPLFRPGARRDSLRFERLRVRSLGPDVAVGVARWVLHRGDSVTGAGPFTLVLRQVGGAWRIVHDHSSSETGYPAGADAEAEAGGEGTDGAGAGGAS